MQLIKDNYNKNSRQTYEDTIVKNLSGLRLWGKKISGKPDCIEEALELDSNAIGIYQPNISQLVGHVPIEMSRLIKLSLTHT